SIAVHDSVEHAAMFAAIDTMPLLTLRWIVQSALDAGADMRDAARAVAVWKERGAIADQVERVIAAHAIALASGRPHDADLTATELARLEPDDYRDLRFPILSALYGGGDSALAERAAQAMDEHYHFAARSAGWGGGDESLEMMCVVAQWRYRRHDIAFVQRANASLR